MHRTHLRIAIVSIPLLGLGVGLGCLGQAERTYFDDLIDGSADATTGRQVDAEAGLDVAEPLDAGNDSPAEARAPVEAGCGPTDTVANCGQCGVACDTDSGTPSSCSDAGCTYTCNAGFGDCVTAAPNTNGCETPLNTTTNCSACGVACDLSHSTDASCTGTSCTYGGCAAGWRDCKTAPPNADGCECNAPACCDGGACQSLHDNGLGQTFYDCTPLGEYNSALALKACTAYTGSAAQCASYPCLDPDSGPIICSAGALTKSCLCWSFGGTNAGLFDNSNLNPGTNGKFCYCPSAAAGDTPWQ
jgi:hypothetical protein